MTPAEREAAFRYLEADSAALIQVNEMLKAELDEERAARSRIQAELDQACADRDMARAQKERAEGLVAAGRICAAELLYEFSHDDVDAAKRVPLRSVLRALGSEVTA